MREDAGFTREDIVNHLESRGIQTRMLFAGNLIKHPFFDDMRKTRTGYRVVGDLVNTDRIMRDTFWVGVYPGMTEEMVVFMCKQIKGFCGSMDFSIYKALHFNRHQNKIRAFKIVFGFCAVIVSTKLCFHCGKL